MTKIRKILVMDDDETVRYILSQMLKYLGYASCFASEGNEAVEIYSAALDAGEPFDAVILDLSVKNGMGGMETMFALKAVSPEVKALISSGFSTDPVMIDFEAYGFCGVLEKPYHMAALGRVLGEAIEV
ncbi:response regulator [Desulfococcus sp.]|uniref:response regulator n=1 Tax=Desulfococcus sp. TaxID=2025834 RepID=UPI0035945D8E